MLTVYTYRISTPKEFIDFSGIPLSELVDAALAVFSHQKEAKIWFGYLDAWMLTPQEDVLLRKVIRKFQCGFVTHFPMALSQSWKNEIDTIYTAELNGDSQTDNNGSSVLNRSSTGHDMSRTESSSDGGHHHNRKARRSQARRVKKGQGSSSEPTEGV
jgi:hypothetical protein